MTAPGVLLLDEVGRVRSATRTATRLLAFTDCAHDLPPTLRALSARVGFAGDTPVVMGIPAGVRSGSSSRARAPVETSP